MPVLAPLPSDVVVPLLELGDDIDHKSTNTKNDTETPPVSVSTSPKHSLKDLQSIVHQYARDGNVAGLRKMIQEHEMLLNYKDEDGLTALHYAARYRNFDVVKMLLDWNQEKPTKDPNGSTFPPQGPRVDVNAESSEKFTPMHFAARYYRKDPSIDSYTPTNDDECSLVGLEQNDDTYKIIRLLHERGGKVNAVDKYSLTPLHYAAMRGSACATHALLACRCKTDPVDTMNMSPLMIACVHGSSSVVQILIHNGARIDLRDKRDNTVLHLAAQYGHGQVLDILLKSVKQNTQEAHEERQHKRLITEFVSPKFPPKFEDLNFIDQTPLYLSMAAIAQISTAATITTKNFGGETTRSMLRKPNIEGNTPLQLAVERNHIEVVRKMLSLIANPDGMVTEMTREESLFPHIAASKGYLEILQSLKKFGFSLGVENEDLEIPLHLAAANNHTDVVRYLLFEALGDSIEGQRRITIDDEIDTDPDVRAEKSRLYDEHQNIRRDTIEKCDRKGRTPLLQTAHEASQEAAEVLLEYKANIFSCDGEGRSAVFWAAKYNNTAYIDWLLGTVKRMEEEAKQQMEQRASRGRGRGRGRIVPHRTLRSFAVVRRAKFEQLVNGSDLDQNTALHIAAANGYLEACIVLKKYNASVDALNEDKQTPLHLASIKGHSPVVNLLLSWSASLAKVKDDDGNSPLHEAAKNGHDAVCSVLLQNNADLNSRNVFEATALDLAASAGHLTCVRVLISYGSNVNGDKFVSTTPLHRAAENGHDKVVQYLIDEKANIAAVNPAGQTALEIALSCEQREVARILLMSKQWELLMKRSNEMPNGRHKEERITPMRLLLAKFPDLASLVMDRCITGANDGPLAVINYNFEFIDDTFMMPFGKGQTLKACNEEGEYPYIDGRVRKSAEPYNKNHDRIFMEHPLKMMANSERIMLLSHPLVVALLKYKWNNLGRYVYYSASLVYVIFLLCFTTFLTLIPAPFNVKLPDGNGTLMDVMDHLKTTCDQIDDYYTPLARLCKTLVLLLAWAQMVKEMYQFYTRRWAYLTVENLLEIFIYVSALLTMTDWSPCTEHSAIRLNWQWMLATLGTFIAWINLLLLIRKLPRFGIFVLMFFDVFKTFSKFAIIFILFILAFSVTFFLMMQNRPEFSSIPLSVMKTTVMTIGEMEYNGIFHGAMDNHEEGLFTKEVAFPVFFIFCIVMTILLMNLLVGLAVDDIKSVQEKAEIKRLSMQVDLVLQVERSMSFLRRRITRSYYSLYPNKMSLWKKFRRLFGSDQLGSLSEIISQQSAEEESSEIKRGFAMQREALYHLQTNIDYLYEKQVKFEGVLESILKKLEDLEGKEVQREKREEKEKQEDEVQAPAEDQTPDQQEDDQPAEPQPLAGRGRRGRF